jgi:uncharacterized membrane protein YwaF
MLLTAPLFGDKHLIGLLFIAIIFLFLGSVLSKMKNLNHKKMILIFMIMFYILEIAKIGYIIYLDKVYPIYQLPLHLCSVPLYLYPLMYFFKNSRFIEEYIKPAAYSLVLIAGVMAMALPTNILGGAINWFPLKDNILPIISFLYHGLMIFSSIYLLISKYYKFHISNYIKVMSVGVFFAIMAIIANALLDKDFMLLNYATGSPLAFIFEISKPLYILSMIGGFAILIGIVFLLTDIVLNKALARKKATQQ